jgi:tripartite-type tricarboxylate transporter receptor subunit TctC
MRYKTNSTLFSILVGLVFCLTIVPSWAEEFYGNKSIRFIVAYSAGGNYDIYTRVIARHFGKHIPGHPSTIVENKTGAGGLIGVNFLYKAKPDGLTVGNWNAALALQQFLGLSGVEFDAPKFESIGAPSRQSAICAITKASGITSLEQWMNSKRPLKLGGFGPGSAPSDMARVLSAALGLPIQLVEGYKGGADVRLALDSGELEGMCGIAWEIFKSATWGKQLGSMTAVVLAMPKAHPEIPKVPLAINFAKNEEARQLIRVALHDVSKVVQIYTAPPGTPKDRVGILRKAFQETLKDPEFQAEAKKAQLDLDPVSGEEVAEVIAGFGKLPPYLLDKLKDILLPKTK